MLDDARTLGSRLSQAVGSVAGVGVDLGAMGA